MGGVRSPFCSHCWPRPLDRADLGRPVWILARHLVDIGGCGIGRGSAGHGDLVFLHSAQCPQLGPNGQGRNRPYRWGRCLNWHFHDHDHLDRGVGLGGGECHEAQPLGHLHRRGHHSDSHASGVLHAQFSSGARIRSQLIGRGLVVIGGGRRWLGRPASHAAAVV